MVLTTGEISDVSWIVGLADILETTPKERAITKQVDYIKPKDIRYSSRWTLGILLLSFLVRRVMCRWTWRTPAFNYPSQRLVIFAQNHNKIASEAD